MTNDDEAFDLALSADALRKAAKDGEAAAQTLIVFAEGRPDGHLARLMKMAEHQGDGAALEGAEGARFIRRMLAQGLSQTIAEEPLATKKERKAARRYLKNSHPPGEFGAMVGVRPFAEMKQTAMGMHAEVIERILSEPNIGGATMRWLVAFMAGHAHKHCPLCEKPFAEDPYEVVFGEDATRFFCQPICRDCAALPDKLARIGRLFAEAPRTPQTLQ
jgi:hypothetical protein